MKPNSKGKRERERVSEVTERDRWGRRRWKNWEHEGGKEGG